MNLASDMKSVVNEISNASTAFTGQITNALSESLEGYIKDGLKGIETKTFAEYAASGRPVTAAIAKLQNYKRVWLNLLLKCLVD